MAMAMPDSMKPGATKAGQQTAGKRRVTDDGHSNGERMLGADRNGVGERSLTAGRQDRGERTSTGDRPSIGGVGGLPPVDGGSGGDGPAERRPASPLQLLHATQVSLEKARIQLGNRRSAMDRGVDEQVDPIGAAYNRIFDSLEGHEAEIEDLMAEAAKGYPVWGAWLSHVKGIGPALASQLLAMLLPPLPERGPSTWYKAAGLAVEMHDGQWRLPRARAGQDGLSYYPRLRRCLFNVATSFVRVGGYYRDQYDQRKRRLTEIHAGDVNWPLHRIDAAARWSMIKLFLSHLYEEYLRANGDTTDRRAYVIDVLKHTGYVAPPQWNGRTKI